MLRQLISPVRALLKCGVVESPALKAGGPTQNSRVSAMAPVLVPDSPAFHTTTSAHLGRKERKDMGSTYVRKELVADGENASVLELRKSREDDRFPDLHLPTRLFNGVMFKNLPILHINATMNNTHFCVSDSEGVCQMVRACGYDGFKNARKGTNVAAQATGFVFGKKMMQRGFRTVRTTVKGLGAGRLSSLRGITFAGVQVVSITDDTPISWNPPRPRKQRRL